MAFHNSTDVLERVNKPKVARKTAISGKDSYNMWNPECNVQGLREELSDLRTVNRQLREKITRSIIPEHKSGLYWE